MAQVKSFSEVEASFQYHQNGHSIFSWVFIFNKPNVDVLIKLLFTLWFTVDGSFQISQRNREIYSNHCFLQYLSPIEQLKQTSDFTSKIHNPRSPEKSCCWEKVVFIWINDNFRVLQHIYSVLYLSIFGAKVYCIFMSVNLEHCCKAEYNNADLHKS